MWKCQYCNTKWSDDVKSCRICRNKRRIEYNRKRFKLKREKSLKGGKNEDI